MSGSRVFTVGDFARFSRTTRDTLHHYDKIGLLSPALRGENNYRYYSNGQLALVNVIRTLQELGLSLTEIKKLKDDRTPDSINELLMRQIDEIDSKINEWVGARKLLFTLQKSIHSVLNIDEKAITIQFLPAEAIIRGDVNDYSRGRNAYDALLSFYHSISERYPNLDLNYPVWGWFSGDRIKHGDWKWPDRYYFYNPEGHDKRPAALYAIGHTRGGYGDTGNLYNRIIDYIDKNDFEIGEDVFEEYPLNEVCISDDSNYLLRVMVAVREKNNERLAK